MYYKVIWQLNGPVCWPIRLSAILLVHMRESSACFNASMMSYGNLTFLICLLRMCLQLILSTDPQWCLNIDFLRNVRIQYSSMIITIILTYIFSNHLSYDVKIKYIIILSVNLFLHIFFPKRTHFSFTILQFKSVI